MHGQTTTAFPATDTGVVCLQVKLCDPHLSALEVRFSQRGTIQIYVYVYLYLYHHRCFAGTKLQCLATEAHVCEQLAHGHYMKVQWSGVKPQLLDREAETLNIISPCHTVNK